MLGGNSSNTDERHLRCPGTLAGPLAYLDEQRGTKLDFLSGRQLRYGIRQ